MYSNAYSYILFPLFLAIFAKHIHTVLGKCLNQCQVVFCQDKKWFKVVKKRGDNQSSAVAEMERFKEEKVIEVTKMRKEERWGVQIIPKA